MARRIQKHSTRLSQAHEGALDSAFRQGQRVQTIDGLPGRVLFVSAAFAPGVTEYQVQLDNGLGAGTYTASQLRPVPDDYRGANQPLPPGLLPAGVRPMAAYMTEEQARERWRQSPEAKAGMTAEEVLRAQAADAHTADLDYPEMGRVLHERPDPGTLIRVIGSRRTASEGYDRWHDHLVSVHGFPTIGDLSSEALRDIHNRDHAGQGGPFPQHDHEGLGDPDEGDVAWETGRDAAGLEGGFWHEAADSYGGPEDPRDEDYNGGEGDTGMYWAEPGQQAWMHENIGPQEEAPPPMMMAPEPEDLPAPLARLAQIEEAGTLWGGTLHRATTINGTQIDDAGDAPEHGTVPRATNPDSYDARSTEGQGDDKWNEPVSGDADKHTLNGATIGMYPEGISAGGGPGLEIGPVVANVPWTGQQRTHLHSWDNGASAQAGDFVSSAQFTNKVPVTQEIEEPAPEVIAADLRAQAALWEMPKGGDVAEHLLSHHGFYEDQIGAEGVDPEDQHAFAHAEGDPRDFQFTGVPHIHTGPWRHNPTPWAGTDRPVADVMDHERPWDRGQVMHTLSSHTAASESDWADHLRQEHGYTDEGIARSLGRGNTPSHLHEAIHDAGLANHGHDPVTYSDPFQAMPHMPGEEGLQDPDPEAAVYDAKPIRAIDPDTWPEDARRRYLSVRQAGVRVKVHGPDDFTLHQAPDDHDDDANDLDTPGDDDQDTAADTEEDKNSLDYGKLQAGAPDNPVNGLDNSLDNAPAGLAAPDPNASMTGPDAETARGQALPPTAWPMTQAPVQQGGPAYTQGTHDQHGTVFPPPPPAPAPGTAGEGAPGEDSAPGEEGDGKKVQLEIKTAAEEGDEDEVPSAQRMQDALREHMRGESEQHEQRIREQDFEHSQGWRTQLPGERTMHLIEQAGGYAEPTDETRLIGTKPMDFHRPADWSVHEQRVHYSSQHALAHFAAAAGSSAFRFEFTAAWTDVVAKAKRLRKAGRVRITHASHGMVIGEVGGDHDVYESGIQRAPGRPQTIQHWACGCPWGSFRQDPDPARQRKYAASRLNGRPCSHVMALQFEALARTRREQKVDADPSAADLGVPHKVVVKSMPPWGAGGWAQTWLAPAASRHHAAAGDADWREPDDPRQHLHDEHGYPHEWLRGMTEDDALQRHDYIHGDLADSVAGHDHHAFGPEYRTHGGDPDYVPDYYGGHNQNRRVNYEDEPGRRFHRYQDVVELAGETAPWERTEEYAQQPHLSSFHGVWCYYRHDGDCPDLGNPHTAESIRHSRPRGWQSDIMPNPMHDPEGWTPAQTASHVMVGSINGRLAGKLHFSRSDDGQAFEVHMLHSRAPGRGVGSALMDDLYSHVKANGRWLDHGERTDDGNSWWASYREPHPEISTHHTLPSEGWGNYWEPQRVAAEAGQNFAGSGGQGAHTPIRYNPMQHPFNDRHEQWTQARGTNQRTADERMGELDRWVDQESPGMTATPAQRATAALLAAGEDPGEIAALAMLAGFTVQADQTNAPWGSENVTKHPPQKPYGATEPLNKDQSPASYGFLSAPDPDNWGSIQEDSALQMPLSNQGSLHAAGWYHGSPWRLGGDEQIEPGHEPVNMDEPDGHVYFTSSPDDAKAWAKNGSDWVNEHDSPGWTTHPHVYEVQPAGEHDADPRGEFEGDRRSSQPLKVVRELHGPGFLHLHEWDCPGCARQASHTALSDPGHKVLVPGAPSPLPADLNYPNVGDFHEDQGSFGYTDRANTAGPSTAMTPRDPGGIRMEESLADDAQAYRRHLVEMHGQPDVDWLPQDYTKHVRDHEDAVRAREIGEPLEAYTGYQPHPYEELAHERRHIRDQWPDAYSAGPLAELKDHPEPALDPDGLTAEGASDGTIGGGDAGTGITTDAPEDVASLSEVAAARVAELRRRFGGTAMGDQSIAEGLTGGGQLPSPVTQEPGMGSGDEYLAPDDQSIQTIGQQQWSGGGTDSDEGAVPAGQPQGSMDDIVASFQRSAAARLYGEGGSPAGGLGNGDIAQAAQAFLSKTADALPDHEAQELISEGKGQRARNLGLLRLEGTHYEDEDAGLAARGLHLDDYDDDVISV